MVKKFLEQAKNPKKKPEKKTCSNKYCSMSKKPTDKFKSATSKLSGNEIIFCNTCYQWYMSSQYCDYCEQVYDTKDTQNQDNKDWVECETCKKWNHVDCEVKNGYRSL